VIEKLDFKHYRIDKENMDKLESKINEIIGYIMEPKNCPTRILDWTEGKMVLTDEPCNCEERIGPGTNTADVLPPVTLTKGKDE